MRLFDINLPRYLAGESEVFVEKISSSLPTRFPSTVNDRVEGALKKRPDDVGFLVALA
jgi:hypothetical protein